MTEDIGVGMADKPMIVGNFYAAEPDMAARPERMHIIALPGSDIGQIAEQPRLGDRQILSGCNLHVYVLSGENMDAMVGPFGNSGVVGQIQDSHGGGIAMGGQNQVETKRLWRLHCAK